MRLALIALPALALPLLGCAVTDRQSSARQYIDDAAITLSVKSRMARDPAVSAMRIGVQTLNGTVQLSGFAASEAERARAARIAGQTAHVEAVRNNILVQPPTR